MKIQRYCVFSPDDSAERKNGEWCKYSDIEPLLRDCQTCKYYSEIGEYSECDQSRHNPVFDDYWEARGVE